MKMRDLIEAVYENSPQGQVSKAAIEFAKRHNILLDLEPHKQGLRLAIWRVGGYQEGRLVPEPGTGALVMTELCRLADEHGVHLYLDVIQGIPKLVQYYWRFGFRAWTEGENDDRERSEFELYKAEWEREAAANDDEELLPITMDRKPGDQPVSDFLTE